MTAPGPRLGEMRPVEVNFGDVAESLNLAFNRATHDAWQQGYELGRKEAVQTTLARVEAEIEHLESLASDASYNRSEEVMETYLESASLIRAAVTAAKGGGE